MLLQKIAILFMIGAVFSFCKKEKEQFTYLLGSTKIIIERSVFNGAAALSIVHLHDNETTAQKAAETVLQNNGGTLLTLKNSQKRLLKFKQDGAAFSVDPNRIFTPLGRKGTLQKWSRYQTAAAEKLASFAAYFISLIPPDKVVIAVHNNTDDAYSIDSYTSSGDLKTDAKEVFINAAKDKDDFFITTQAVLFEKLKAENYNVVLQHNQRATDDGSLSIFFAKKETSYVNVEAQHGHIDEQIKMLEVLKQILP